MEYKGNSYKSKQQSGTSGEREKVKPVVTAGAVTTKKKEGVILKEDVSDVKNYIVKDVIIPTAKKLLYDVVTNALGISLYGTADFKRGNGSGTPAGRVSYQKYYSDDRNGSAVSSRTSSYGFDYDKLVFDNPGDAEIVLQAMDDMLDQGYIVSIADLYDLAGVSCTNYAANKYGWTDLKSAKAIRVREGWVLRLPKPMPI
jgi:hypothetical protein